MRGQGARAALAAALALGAWGWACSPMESPHPAVDSFGITYDAVWVQAAGGTWAERNVDTLAEDPVPFGARTKVGVTIRASSSTGGFDGYVSVSAVPGEVRSVESATTDVLRTSLRVRSGEDTRAEVILEGAYGDTRLWVEDVGLVPGPPREAACDDGEDNDGDGLADYPLDPGCFTRNDDTEESGSHSVGVSEVIPFENPRLSNAQGCGAVPTLRRQALTIDRGILMVTGVFVAGFTVTDFAYLEGGCDPTSGCCGPGIDGRYAHMYAYNFNTPYGMRICDRLASVTGTVEDFYGFTEMNFPSWQMYDIDPSTPELDLMRVAPHDLTPELCPITAHLLGEAELLSSTSMESWEGGLVEVANGQLPPADDWVLCDLNGDFEVAYRLDQDVCVPADEVSLPDVYCTTRSAGYCCEVECNDVCEQRMCAEIQNYRGYGQYPIGLGTGRILLDTANVPGFNPRDLVRSGQTDLTRVTGVLASFAPLPYPWIMRPRCRQDIYIEGDDRYPDVPIYRRCVPSEETGDYEDPY